LGCGPKVSFFQLKYHKVFLLFQLEPVFIIENAGWTRNFAALQGKKSQESFVDFKIF